MLKNGPFVLTYTAGCESQVESLLALADQARPRILSSAVGGFGIPELRIGAYDSIRGTLKIEKYIREKFRLELPS